MSQQCFFVWIALETNRNFFVRIGKLVLERRLTIMRTFRKSLAFEYIQIIVGAALVRLWRLIYSFCRHAWRLGEFRELVRFYMNYFNSIQPMRNGLSIFRY